MKQANTNPKSIAICMFGDCQDNDLILKIKDSFINKFVNHEVTFFETYNTDDFFQNIWKVVYQKRFFEVFNLSNREFNLCIWIKLKETIVDLSILENIDIDDLSPNTIYFPLGRFNPENYSTEIILDIICADSITFDLAGNFGLVGENLPLMRKGGILETDFYYYLKSLKINTQCINYENSHLFKRTA